MPGKGAVAAIQAQQTGVHVRGAVVAQLEATLHALDGPARDAIVDHIHHAANGAGTIEQRGGTAQHLHRVGQQCLDRHGVVGADIRGIGAAGAVLQDTHPRALLPANHRLPDTGTKGGIGDPGHVAQGVADGGAGDARQGIAIEGGYRQGGFRLLLLQGCGDQHVFNGVGRLRPGMGAGNRQRNRQVSLHSLLLNKRGLACGSSGESWRGPRLPGAVLEAKRCRCRGKWQQERAPGCKQQRQGAGRCQRCVAVAQGAVSGQVRGQVHVAGLDGLETDQQQCHNQRQGAGRAGHVSGQRSHRVRSVENHMLY